jgi:hypothetical protein
VKGREGRRKEGERGRDEGEEDAGKEDEGKEDEGVGGGELDRNAEKPNKDLKGSTEKRKGKRQEEDLVIEQPPNKQSKLKPGSISQWQD